MAPIESLVPASVNNDCSGHPSPAVALIDGVALFSPASMCHSPQKIKDEPHPTDDEDATTAYSSWVEDSDSSCLTFRSSRDVADGGSDEDDEANSITSLSSESSSRRCAQTTEEENDLPGANIDNIDSCDGITSNDACGIILHRQSSSYSYFSAFSTLDGPMINTSSQPNFEGDEIHVDCHPHIKIVVVESRGSRSGELSTAESSPTDGASYYSTAEEKIVDTHTELMERACHMLQCEQSDVDYKIDKNCYNTTSAVCGRGDTDTTCLPTDLNCRSKMLEWSCRVVEFSFPHHSQPQEDTVTHPPRYQRKRPRKYSIQTLHIVSQAFLLIDRLVTLHLTENNGQTMERSHYKLTCMVCLHLVAKTCGLFGLYASDSSDLESGENQTSSSSQEEQEECCASNKNDEIDSSSSCCYHLSQQSTSTLSTSSLASKEMSEAFSSLEVNTEGQTILSTPGHSTDVRHSPEQQLEVQRSRPPLNLLSIMGLSTLCQHEFTVEQLVYMEWKVLDKLNWKLVGSSTCIDWSNVLLEMLAVCVASSNGHHHSHGIDLCALDIEQEVREHTLTNLEMAMESNLITAPSLAAWAAVTRALNSSSDRSPSSNLSNISCLCKSMMQSVFQHMEEEEEVNFLIEKYQADEELPKLYNI